MSLNYYGRKLYGKRNKQICQLQKCGKNLETHILSWQKDRAIGAKVHYRQKISMNEALYEVK